MDDSILINIKFMLGILPEDNNFDNELILHINSVLGILYQLGVGKKPFVLKDGSETFADFLTDCPDLEMIKTYIYLKVKKVFDPPTSGSHMESIDNLIREYEFRINVWVDKEEES